MKGSKSVKVLWVDDELTDRTEDAKNLEYGRKRLRVSVVHPTELLTVLSKLETREKIADIFLVDYFLDEVPGKNNERYEQRGLAAAGKIRELEPERPIYVVTHKEMEREEGIFASEAQAAKASFNKILTFKELQREGHDILYYDALDFNAIRESPREDLNALFELLKAPKGMKERLRLVLPDELREGLVMPGSIKHPEGNTIAFAKWVREILLSVPGFLYNELRASTYMGMNIDSFNRVSSKLKRARYSGIFARTNPPLWWVSGLNDIIFSNPKALKSDKTNPWEVAPIVFGIHDKDRSSCSVCKDFFPETVGMNLMNDKDLRPVHYRCTIPHPKKRREPYFDEPRAVEVKSSF